MLRAARRVSSGERGVDQEHRALRGDAADDLVHRLGLRRGRRKGLDDGEIARRRAVEEGAAEGEGLHLGVDLLRVVARASGRTRRRPRPRGASGSSRRGRGRCPSGATASCRRRGLRRGSWSNACPGGRWRWIATITSFTACSPLSPSNVGRPANSCSPACVPSGLKTFSFIAAWRRGIRRSWAGP